jgi:hypothetical protein
VTPGLLGLHPEGPVSLSQRVNGRRRAQAAGLGRCRLPITANARVAACHFPLYVIRLRRGLLIRRIRRPKVHRSGGFFSGSWCPRSRPLSK